jgi:hypothetical protein
MQSPDECDLFAAATLCKAVLQGGVLAMIRIYPSRLKGEPIETHQHQKTSLADWFFFNVDGFDLDREHPIIIEVNCVEIAPDKWRNTVIDAQDDVRIYPKPYAIGAGVSAWVYAYYAVVAAVALYSVYMILTMSSQGAANTNTNGDGLELNPAKANSAKLGDPIREVFGRQRIYPDYVVQPVNRFVSGKPETYQAHLFLSIGVGEFEFTKNDIRIGNTPIAALGSDVEYVVYPPGADVSGDFRSENWWSSTEVGGTSSGAGLDMAVTAPDGNTVSATTATASGYTVFFDISTPADKADFKDTWVAGKNVSIKMPADFSVQNQNGYSLITGDSLKELNAYVGMPVTLYIGKSGFDLLITSYQDSKTDPDTQITTPITPRVTLSYADNTPFHGLGERQQRLSISHRGCEYRISEVNGLTVTLDRVIDGIVDKNWTGFIPRTVMDFIADNINDKERWLGPFLACPENEKVDAIELNFAFPSGICDWDDEGRKERQSVLWAVEYRYVNQTNWTHIEGKWYEKNVNGLGYTLRYNFPEPGLIEVRARRRNIQNDDGAHDNMYWQALRGRLLKRPTSYPDVTTIGITVTTGGKLAAQSDRRVNIVATRKYNNGKSRSISGALKHVLDSIGLIDYDAATIDEMEANLWTPNKQYFDCQVDKTQSVLDMLHKICTAGFAYPFLSDGLVSVGYEGEKNWVGMITPQEMAEPLQTSFTAPSADDYDGIDVTYINSRTWSEETVLCRLDDVPNPQKIESYKLDGVVNEDQAYRIGMRRLMKYRYQRLSFSCKTEMDALCYNYGDRIILTDDIPGHKTISCLITDIRRVDNNAHIQVSELLDWQYSNPKILIRWQDGSASGVLSARQIDGGISTPWLPEFDEVILNDAAIEPPRAVFCESKQIGYDAVIDNIEPEDDGICTITAHEYQLSYYDYDDAIYPFGDKNYLSSKPYPYVDIATFETSANLVGIANKTMPNCALGENINTGATLDSIVIRDNLSKYSDEPENINVSASLKQIGIKELLTQISANAENFTTAVNLDSISVRTLLVQDRMPVENITMGVNLDVITIKDI